MLFSQIYATHICKENIIIHKNTTHKLRTHIYKLTHTSIYTHNTHNYDITDSRKRIAFKIFRTLPLNCRL